MPKQTTKKKLQRHSIKVNKQTPKKAVKKVPPKTKKTINKKAIARKAISKPAHKPKKKKTVKVSDDSKKTTLNEPTATSNRDRMLDLFSDGLFSKNQKIYKGITFEKHFNGEIFKNDFGEFCVINDKAIIKTVSNGREAVKQKLLLDLKVISGISDITEGNLKLKGFDSVISLTKHLRFGNEASEYFNSVLEQNGNKIYKQLSSRLTSSNPLLLLSSCFFDLSELVFIDIETMGLHNCPLFLIGIATVNKNQLSIAQILLRDLSEEKSALHFLSEHLNNKQAICSYNGKSFDIPFIRKRMERHDLIHNIVHPHFDIMHFSKKAFAGQISNCRLTTLEAKLKFKEQKIFQVILCLISMKPILEQKILAPLFQ
jgi:uncharacterized protein